MRKLLIATTNPGKYREIIEVIGDLPFKFLFLGEMGVEAEDFVEDGETFEENAFKKARYFADKTGLLTVGEDSGILVDALPGELGVKTRRWGAGEKASDQEWIDYFMQRMDGEENRGASFVCVSCLVGDGPEKYFKGETRGIITNKMMATILPGIPLSSCFVAEGGEKVYAEMSEQEKNAISHRGKAMFGLRNFLANHHA